jgi:D-beta-D-heptose 7-phosphate kinase/D-beta-D-heptose 1-phosphate adenosyltransferase
MGYKVIFTNGCFDILHAGHIKLLSEARKMGNELHVGINSDESITNLKGPFRPINCQHDRYEVLAAIKYVDFIHVFDEPTPYNLIMKLKPDIIVKGGDWKIEDVVGNDIAEVRIVPLLGELSTSETINKLNDYTGWPSCYS